MGAEEQRVAWNRAGEVYQARNQFSTQYVHYGPLAPDERTLKLLGKVAGLQVLEIGCGGGQNAVALARAGAHVIGLDVSDRQIAFARRLAAAEGAAVRFVRGCATDLSFQSGASLDLILAVAVFPYVAALEQALAECARVLRPGGRLVVSQDHPIRACYWDEETQEETILPVRSYFDDAPLRWLFAETGEPMVSHPRPIGRWVEALHRAGFQLRRLLELPMPPEWAGEPWADEYTTEIAVHLPQVLILVAERTCEDIGY